MHANDRCGAFFAEMIACQREADRQCGILFALGDRLIAGVAGSRISTGERSARRVVERWSGFGWWAVGHAARALCGEGAGSGSRRVSWTGGAP